jgi:hypothetical protein
MASILSIFFQPPVNRRQRERAQTIRADEADRSAARLRSSVNPYDFKQRDASSLSKRTYHEHRRLARNCSQELFTAPFSRRFCFGANTTRSQRRSNTKP